MENLANISAALTKAQSEFKVAKKDSENPFFKSNYADLEAVVSACRPSLSKNGLCFSQAVVEKENKFTLVTKIIHASGECIETDYPIFCAKMDAQGFGSAVTYAKRYSLAAALGVVASDEDDDGETAMARPPKKRNEAPISAAEQKQLIAVVEQKGFKPSEITEYLKTNYGVEKSSQLKKWQYEEVIVFLMEHK